jgi:toxin ParE1/3/4
VKAARWLRRALLDLEDAYSHIAADNPAAARRLVDQIEQGVLQLSRYPNLGRAGRVPGTRELVIAGTPFLVVYRMEADQASILTILHGSRRWPVRSSSIAP